MSDTMRPQNFSQFMEGLLNEYAEEETALGLPRLLRMGQEGGITVLPGQNPENLLGPAAGPHTQLAGGIVTAYLAGGRYFELKTVQKLYGKALGINKPCIYALDEGYNSEWSSEFSPEQALAEYIRAYYAICLLSREWYLGRPDGFIFNISVGYDLAGIKSAAVDSFIEGAKNASSTEAWRECTQWAQANLHRFDRVDAAFLASISPRLSTSVTLSTLHGCPAGEIEAIAAYLLEKKGLHTFIKCNPTLLGARFVSRVLHRFGYSLRTDPRHFKDDLQMEQALPMFGRLKALGMEKGLVFGLKLSNTLPVVNNDKLLDAPELYLSGPPLYPLTVNLAAKLAENSGGELPISYCGGLDAENAPGLLRAGLYPLTCATILLKPGGYTRLTDIAEACAGIMPPPHINIKLLKELAARSLSDGHYHKLGLSGKKNGGKLPLEDCGGAPCSMACPFTQDIPAYLRAFNRQDELLAAHIIRGRNTLPSITGYICPHRCEGFCRRANYDEPLQIRSCKRIAIEDAEITFYQAKYLPKKEEALVKGRFAENLPPALLGRAAVVGAGPAGLSTAYLLRRGGYKVDVYERAEKTGGLPRQVIPAFRLPDEALVRDLKALEDPDIAYFCGQEIENPAELLQRYTVVVLATGASLPGCLHLEYGESINALDFLREAKQSPHTLDVGCSVAVVGGGNTAIDAARTALRLPGVVEAHIVYRRSRALMPAEAEELALALTEGVQLHPLALPVGIQDAVLNCEYMRLSLPGPDGRREPRPLGKFFDLPVDTLVAAVGEQVDSEYYRRAGLALDKNGLPRLDENLQSSIPRLYVAGDGKAGPATVAQAIADAWRIAGAVTGLKPPTIEKDERAAAAARRRKVRKATETMEPGRCLSCDLACECCVDVCPNRANRVLTLNGKRQILHMDALCNECGNCAVFCPYEGAPYRDKPTFFATREGFAASANPGIVFDNKGSVISRGLPEKTAKELAAALKPEI
ncbi:MAG: putative selenate reductase subunit YgfK [Clostridiales bacterium]|nr:putative selenate reductase subunit YgfK [Clostridiales bacterium]